MKKILIILITIPLIFSSCKKKVLIDELTFMGVYQLHIMYFNGKPFDGIGIDKTTNGSLIYEVNYKDGLKYGVGEKYFETGELMVKENWEDGLKNGLWREYYKNGNLKEEEYYKDGKRNGLTKQYYETGELHWKRYHKDDEQHGGISSYYKSGQLNSIVFYHIIIISLIKKWCLPMMQTIIMSYV